MAKKANLNGENFGIEIEVAGASRTVIVKAICEAVNGRVTGQRVGYLSATLITDEQDRIWRVCTDSSIDQVNHHRGNEIVSPILTYPDDIEILKTVIRKVKATNAIVNRSCSIHIHISGDTHTAKSINNLAKMIHKNEDLIFQALNVNPSRRAQWTRPIETDFIDKIVKDRPPTKEKINEAWFGRYNSNPQHYNRQRYHGLNLSNLWQSINTIEFRYFNGSMNCKKIIPWIQLCLAMSVKARNAKAASHKKIQTDNPKFNFRVWLVAGLGMIGKEFMVARNTLTKNLPGNTAWR